MPRHPADYIPTDLGTFHVDPSQHAAPQLYQAMRHKILSLELRPGVQISETALAEQAGVSRTPARQAIKDLVRDNLLVSQASRGTFVTWINTRRLVEALIVRRKLEPYLAGECARHDKRQDLALTLQSILSEHQNALDQDDSVAAYQCDFLFHKAICTFGGEGLLWEFILAARTEADRLHALSKYRAENLQLALDQHREVAAAIAAGDSELSETKMEMHMMFNEDILGRMRSRYPDVFETDES